MTISRENRNTLTSVLFIVGGLVAFILQTVTCKVEIKFSGCFYEVLKLSNQQLIIVLSLRVVKLLLRWHKSTK